jgi:hypothetical protein
VPDEPPRRRITDRDQEQAVDLLNERLDRYARRLARLEDKMDAVAKDLRDDMREDNAQLRTEILEFRKESKTAHHNIAYGKDPEDHRKQLPPQPATLTWGTVAKAVTLFVAIFTPTTAVIVAVLGAHS